MGQIVSSAAKPKRCNLNQLSQVPTPAAGEYILVSSDNSMNAAGQGNFDCYIEGDGTKAATELELKYISTADALKLSNFFSIKVTTGINMINPAKYVNGKYINSSGVEVDNAAWSHTPYIPVEAGVEYYAVGMNVNGGVVAMRYVNWYDAEKNHLSQDGNSFYVTAPSNAAYCICSTYNNNGNYSKLKNTGLFKGHLAYAQFEEYYEEYSLLFTDETTFENKDNHSVINKEDVVGYFTEQAGTTIITPTNVTPSVNWNVGYVRVNGMVGALDTYRYSDRIFLKKGDKLTVTSKDPSGANVARISEWTGDGTFIRTIETGTTAVTTVEYVPSADTYIVLSYYYDNGITWDIIRYVAPDPLKAVISSEVEEIINPSLEIFVGSNRDVKTIAEAFLLAEASTAPQKYIYLDAETFNVFDGIDISEQTTSFRGLDVPNNTFIIGNGVDETIISGSLSAGLSNITYNNISTLNLEFVGGCKDLTILAHNLRYCVHSDVMQSTDQELEMNILMENVKFYHDGLDSGVTATGMAYGLGCRSASKSKFVNCQFVNNKSGRVVFNLHNNAAALKASLVEFVGCTFFNMQYNNDGDINIMSEGTGNSDKVSFIGCHFNGGISTSVNTNVNVYDQTIICGNNVRVYSKDGLSLLKLEMDGFEKMYSISTFTSGTAVTLKTYNRANTTTDKNRVYGYALNSANNGDVVMVQTKGLIQCSSVDITGTAGQFVSLVNGKLAVSDADPVGIIICDGMFIKMFGW